MLVTVGLPDLVLEGRGAGSRPSPCALCSPFHRLGPRLEGDTSRPQLQLKCPLLPTLQPQPMLRWPQLFGSRTWPLPPWWEDSLHKLPQYLAAARGGRQVRCTDLSSCRLPTPRGRAPGVQPSPTLTCSVNCQRSRQQEKLSLWLQHRHQAKVGETCPHRPHSNPRSAAGLWPYSGQRCPCSSCVRQEAGGPLTLPLPSQAG